MPWKALIWAVCMLLLSGCVTTQMQGYADLQRPSQPIQHIAVVAPPPLVAALAQERSKRGLIVQDGNTVVPPTRQYKDAEIRQLLSAGGIDGVLVISVAGDTGVQERYAGTIMSGNYVGTPSSGSMITTSTPVYRYSRSVAFQARLSEPSSGRTLWVGNGQTKAGGALFMGDATSARDAASAIMSDLQAKALVAAGSA